jgi:hypothetical protein
MKRKLIVVTGLIAAILLTLAAPASADIHVYTQPQYQGHPETVHSSTRCTPVNDNPAVRIRSTRNKTSHTVTYYAGPGCHGATRTLGAWKSDAKLPFRASHLRVR